MFFISPKTLFWFLRYANCCDFSLSSPTFLRFKEDVEYAVFILHEMKTKNLFDLKCT